MLKHHRKEKTFTELSLLDLSGHEQSISNAIRTYINYAQRIELDKTNKTPRMKRHFKCFSRIKINVHCKSFCRIFTGRLIHYPNKK